MEINKKFNENLKEIKDKLSKETLSDEFKAHLKKKIIEKLNTKD